MKTSPSLDLLNRRIVIDAAREMPLHAQTRRALRAAIDEHFEDGQQFWTEAALIQRLQVSQITVRRALQDLSREGVLQRRAAKGSFVLKGAPARAAALTVGIFIPEWNSDFLMAMLEHIAGVCREEGHRLQVYHTYKGEKTADVYRQMERSPQEEGVILLANPAPMTRELHRALAGRGYRTVNVEARIADYAGDYIGGDDEQGVRLGMEHLIEVGHRRIALLVNEPEEMGSVTARIRAFQSITREHDLSQSRIVRCATRHWEDSYEAAYGKMDELWALKPRPTAIFAVSDPGAWAALKWLAEHKIRVPQQVSILGFDDDRPSRFTHPALSTLAPPIAAIARRAVTMLAEDAGHVRAEFLPSHLVVRQSTAPPASTA